jgi:hypothetical protein
MAEVSWSLCGGADCVRLGGLAGETAVHVRPVPAAPDRTPAVGAGAGAGAAGLPPMAGQLVRDGGDLCFVPRFPFVAGTAYAVSVGGADAAVLVRPEPALAATTEVLGIWPTSAEVPRNLLRMYVLFSAPMSEGYAAAQVRVVDDAGHPLDGALLPAEYELWDAARRRLTVLFEPARIKRGLSAHRQSGYPLQTGKPFRLVVGDGLRDAAGGRLRAPAERRYQVGADQRSHVAPDAWTVTVPAAGSSGALAVTFDRPLDHGLLGRCLHVTGPDGQPVAGLPEPGPEERSWRLTPRRPWAPGPYQLVVDPVLEDLAGNSVSRVFDRDLARAQDDPRLDRPAAVTFRST